MLKEQYKAEIMNAILKVNHENGVRFTDKQRQTVYIWVAKIADIILTLLKKDKKNEI